MHAERPESSWLGKGCLALACVLGGVVLISCCGGYFVYRSWFLTRVERINPVAVAFLNDISADRAEDAYARTSAGFRARVSLEQFRASLRRYRSLGGPYDLSDLAIAGSQGFGWSKYIAMLGDLKTGRQLLNLAMVEEEGEWRVEDFTSPDADGGLENSLRILLEGRGP
jgi:hypothetical protein